MSVPYYIGARAIAERLGYRNPKTVIRLAIREGLPISKRNVPLKTGGFQRHWAISESALTAWELVAGQRAVSRLRARQEQRSEERHHPLAS